MAVAADEVEDMAALQTTLPAITLVSDPTLAGLQAWGVLIRGAEHPSPATFVVTNGKITYRRLLEAGGDWPSYAELSRAL